MKDYNLIIGSHVSMNKSDDYLLGALHETINNGANAMMIYTGPPQNTIRTSTENFFIPEFYRALQEQNLIIDNVVIHAPYIINLANTTKQDTFDIAVEFLKKEIQRADEIGVKIIVLHPGSAVGALEKIGLDRIIEGLNLVLTVEQKAVIALETMAGKGSELGTTFEQLKYIIDNVTLKEKVGVCWDTCHMHDAGYRFKDELDQIIDQFDQLIGLERLLCLHINDSKNPLNSHKDRHENLGYGYLGFETILKIVYHPRFDGIIKLLETPFVDVGTQKISPYKIEIEMLKQKQFTDPFKNSGKKQIDLGD